MSSGVQFNAIKFKLIGNISPCEDCACMPMCLSRDFVYCELLMDYLKSEVYPNLSTKILKCDIFTYTADSTDSRIKLVRKDRHPEEIEVFRQKIKAHYANLSHTHRYRVMIMSMWFKAAVFIGVAYMKIRMKIKSLKIRAMGENL